jgi:hypothetical protein
VTVWDGTQYYEEFVIGPDVRSAMELLPEAEQRAYRESTQSIVDARKLAPANEGRKVVV